MVKVEDSQELLVFSGVRVSTHTQGFGPLLSKQTGISKVNFLSGLSCLWEQVVVMGR